MMLSFSGKYLILILFVSDVICESTTHTPNKTEDKSKADEKPNADSLESNIDIRKDEDSRFVHTENGYIISLGILLLLVITVTSFISKKYKVRILPDATLCLLYGIIIGIIIRYGRSDAVTLEHGYRLEDLNVTEPPEYLLNSFHKQNYIYKLQEVTKKIPKESYKTRNVLIFDPEIFFYLILPPIMFVAGLRMNKKHFVTNFGAVMTIAIVGSFVTAMLFSGSTYMYATLSRYRTNKMFLSGPECMLLGAILAPTDPVSVLNVFNELKVEPTLNAIVFGESALNDVVSLVLYDAVEDYAIMQNKYPETRKSTQIIKSIGRFFGVLFGSIMIGMLVGAVGAIITKISTINEFPLLETAFYIIISYSSYLAGEMLHCTGVVSILFCGMFNSHYTNCNLSYDSRKVIEQIFDLIEFIATNFVFSYIGISLFAFPKHSWNGGFIIWSMISLLIARAIIVYGLCFLLNLRRSKRFPLNSQHVLFFAGLKGAVSFALAIRNTMTQSRQIMLSTTLTLVLITVLIFGSLISTIIKKLNVPVNVSEDVTTIPASQSNDFTETHDQDSNFYNYYHGEFLKKWHYYDMKLFTPLFTKSGPPLLVQLKNVGSTIQHCCCNARKSRLRRYDALKSGNNLNSSNRAINRSYDDIIVPTNDDDEEDEEFNEASPTTSQIYGFSVNYKSTQED